MVKSDFLGEAITDDATQSIVRQLVVESERKYKTLVENALVGIYVINDRNVLYANPYLLNLLGYSENDYHDLTLDRFIEPSYLKAIVEKAQRRLAGDTNPECSVFKLVCRDGRVVDVCSKGLKCIYQGNPAILGTLIDITGQKSDQARLKEIEVTLEEAPVAIMHVDKSERVTYCNESVGDVLRCDRRDIPGTLLSGLVKHSDPDKVVSDIMRSCQRKPWSGAIRFRLTPDDEFAAKAVPIADADNEFKGIALYLTKR